MSLRQMVGGRLSRQRNRERTKHLHRYALTGILLTGAITGSILVTAIINSLGLKEQSVELGATFSKKYATELGLDWRATYLATLDDLEVRALRIPVYWDEIEIEPGQFDFSDVDWQLHAANQRGTKIILAIGLKVPRWPECHIPAWGQDLEDEALHARTMMMLQNVVQHYSSSPEFFAWQVENEPFFPFGDCPRIDRSQLQSEVDLVRALDDRPIVITDAGELSDWVRAASIGDILGISTYRDVWNKYLGHLFWPIGPRWYAARLKAIRPLVDDVFVSELQTEPWSPGPILDWDIDEQLEHMNPTKLNENLAFARQMGVSEVYVWGIEWWYWLKMQGHPEMWEAGRQVFQPNL
ncbi:MAG: hypothetical protein V1738_01450 [Patescibacteria group bacterium]